MRSNSSSVRYSFLGAAFMVSANEKTRVSDKLSFARWRILFSEQSLQQIVPDVGCLLFSFVDRFALIERQSVADVIEHSNLPAQSDFEILESFGFLMRIAP